MKRGGSIINICSLASFYGLPNNPCYVASKGGLKQLSKALLEVLDLPPEKIKEISKLGRERIKSRFSINRIVKKYEELYEEISMS